MTFYVDVRLKGDGQGWTRSTKAPAYGFAKREEAEACAARLRLELAGVEYCVTDSEHPL